jgi:hypothetical protein
VIIWWKMILRFLLAIVAGNTLTFAIFRIIPPISILESIIAFIGLFLFCGFISTFLMAKDSPVPSLLHDKDDLKWGNENWLQIRWRNIVGSISGAIFGVIMTFYSTNYGDAFFDPASFGVLSTMFVFIPPISGLVFGLLGGFIGIISRDYLEQGI